MESIALLRVPVPGQMIKARAPTWDWQVSTSVVVSEAESVLLEVDSVESAVSADGSTVALVFAVVVSVVVVSVPGVA